MKTAVEWLVEQLSNYDLKIIELFEKEIEQSKEIEKQQIIDARVTSPLLDTCNKNDYVIEAEQYYNETFKNK
jgi:hypothetical protein